MLYKPRFTILDETDDSIVISKPGGFFVHQPENGFRVPRDKVVLQNLRDQIRCEVYPIHRLDSATWGILLLAKSKNAASELSQAFQQTALKDYFGICRGWLPLSGQIDIPLLSDSSENWQESLTYYKRIKHFEIKEILIGKRYSDVRYSLGCFRPVTGRFHQIRRHLNRVSHPIIGDGNHGDSHYNRYFRELTGIAGLNLWAHRLSYFCPFRNQQITIYDQISPRWYQLGQFLNFDFKEFMLTNHYWCQIDLA